MSIYLHHRKKYKELFAANEELRALAESVFSNHRHPKNLREGYALFALGKTYKTHAAILLLCEQGYGEDAAILSRSLFDLAVCAPYVVADESGVAARRFVAYDFIVREKLLKNGLLREEFEKRGATDASVKAKIEEISRKAARVKASYGDSSWKKGWSGKTLKEMAEEVGAKDKYETAYALQCDLAHSNVSSTNDYVRESADGVTMDITPSDNWVERTLILSIDYFASVIDAWDRAFGFGLQTSLEEFAENYAQIMRELKKKRKLVDPA